MNDLITIVDAQNRYIDCTYREWSVTYRPIKWKGASVSYVSPDWFSRFSLFVNHYIILYVGILYFC